MPKAPRIEEILDVEDEENELPKEVLTDLGDIQNDLEEVAKQQEKREQALAREFDVKKQPIWKRRNDLLKTVPEFWLKCFENHPCLQAMIIEEDKDALKFLESMEYTLSEKGDVVTFHFKTNPYFTNPQLKKFVREDEDGNIQAESTKIEWKAGKSLIKTGSDKGAKRDAASIEESFFTWFDCEKYGEGELMEIFSDLNTDPLPAFLGEIDEEGIMMADDDDDEEDDEDDEDE
ncbi:hypothetical protein CYMTET_6101 [Cymbomonas tetramitiformis]|uniref:Nucleosome assembly protein n=1 Tax=Cymbomonas tetramitiformis TaxID=36881 RepID=A0AAE0GXV1_9CHLO|nr:hypothetical protein CYMTET_6101 [Cymbomonas tetramitiformis]|eukprot:gene27273-33587_t